MTALLIIVAALVGLALGLAFWIDALRWRGRHLMQTPDPELNARPLGNVEVLKR